MITKNTKKARAAGYHALTCVYRLPREQGLLDSVLADMRRGNISHVLVKNRSGVAVWRRGRTVDGGRRTEDGGKRRGAARRGRRAVRGRIARTHIKKGKRT